MSDNEGELDQVVSLEMPMRRQRTRRTMPIMMVEGRLAHLQCIRGIYTSLFAAVVAR